MLGAGGGIRLTSSEKIIQVVDEVTYAIVVSENPLHGFCEEVKEVWSRPQPEWQALIYIVGALPLDAKEVPVLSAYRDKAKCIFQIDLA